MAYRSDSPPVQRPCLNGLEYIKPLGEQFVIKCKKGKTANVIVSDH
jgi:hypothetical protein